jgi:hypothetical protein
MAISITARDWLRFAIASCLLPELKRDWKRVDVEVTPPFSFVTRAMKLAVVDPTNRNDELVAHSASEGARLGKGEVMRVGRHTAAHEASLAQHESPMVLIPQANRFSQGLD